MRTKHTIQAHPCSWHGEMFAKCIQVWHDDFIEMPYSHLWRWFSNFCILFYLLLQQLEKNGKFPSPACKDLTNWKAASSLLQQTHPHEMLVQWNLELMLWAVILLHQFATKMALHLDAWHVETPKNGMPTTYMIPINNPSGSNNFFWYSY